MYYLICVCVCFFNLAIFNIINDVIKIEVQIFSFHFQIAAMTKSPYPLLDSIMLGPLLAYANIYFGSPLPELYIALGIAVSY